MVIYHCKDVWEASSESSYSLLTANNKIGEQKKKVNFKTTNLEKAHDLGVISEENLKDQSRVLMGL